MLLLDGLLGRCQVEPFDLFRFGKLPTEDVAQLNTELQTLVREGDQWTSPKTQCVLSYYFFTVKNQLPYDAEFCDLRQPENALALIQASASGSV